MEKEQGKIMDNITLCVYTVQKKQVKQRMIRTSRKKCSLHFTLTTYSHHEERIECTYHQKKISGYTYVQRVLQEVSNTWKYSEERRSVCVCSHQANVLVWRYIKLYYMYFEKKSTLYSSNLYQLKVIDYQRSSPSEKSRLKSKRLETTREKLLELHEFVYMLHYC